MGGDVKNVAAHIESPNLPVPSQTAIMSKNCAWGPTVEIFAIVMTGYVGVPIFQR